jgi:hypothetical protein
MDHSNLPGVLGGILSAFLLGWILTKVRPIVRFAAILVLSIAMPAAAPGIELRKTHTLGTPRAARGGLGRVQYVSWLDDETIVYWSLNGKFVCRDLKNGVDRWKLDEGDAVKDWSVSRKDRKLAVVLWTFNEKDDELRVLDCADGKRIAAANGRRFF